MYLGISSSLEHSSPEEWADKHKALGLECVKLSLFHRFSYFAIKSS